MSEDLIRTEGDHVDDADPIIAPKNKNVQWAELVGSSFLFATAYLTLYITYDLVTALAAAHFDISPVLFFDTIKYDNTFPNGESRWYGHNVKRIFVVGSAVMGFLGVFFYILFLMLRKSFIFVRLFTLWGSLISFAVLAQRMMCIPFAGNFEYRKLDALGFELAIFTSYMFYKPSTEWAVGFLGFVLVLAIGILYAKPFLQTAWSSTQIGSEGERFRFLRQQVILPCIFGASIVTLVLFPANIIPNTIAFIGSIICLLVMAGHAMLMGSFKIPRQKTWERWPIVPTIIFFLLIGVIKTVLTTGVAIPNPNLNQIFNLY